MVSSESFTKNNMPNNYEQTVIKWMSLTKVWSYSM